MTAVMHDASMAINDALFDRFSLLHFASGYVKRRVGLSFGQALALAIAWEVVENDLKDKWPGLFPHPSHDSRRNAAGDVIASMAGYLIARR